MRAAYPASVSSELLGKKGLAYGAGHLPAVTLPGYDGRGVTIALLDTGVDRGQPHLRGRVLRGIDIVDGRDDTPAAVDPGGSGRVEHHGTEMAGILVGAGGPAGISGVATGASVLPIRIAGWQHDLKGGWAVYSRTDQLIAGLERAVDPNVDGDAHDAARIALIGVAASYGAFADSPEARAIRGRSGSTRSWSRRSATTGRPGLHTAASRARAARPTRSRSGRPTSARRPRKCRWRFARASTC